MELLAGNPYYQSIADQLRSEILDGTLAGKLPTQLTLCERYGVARETIRQAAALLSSEGLIETQGRRGTFIRSVPPVRRVAGDRFRRAHREAGRAAYLVEADAGGWEPRVEVLEIGERTAPDRVMRRLGLDGGDHVLVRRRRYRANNFPMEVATSYVPWRIADGTPMVAVNTGPGGIYARLEELGFHLDHFDEEATVRAATDDEADQLRLRPGVPVLIVERIAVDTSGVAVELCDTVMVADRYILSYRLPAD